MPQITDKAGYFSENKALLKAHGRILTTDSKQRGFNLVLSYLVEPAIKKQLTLHLQLISELLRVFA